MNPMRTSIRVRAFFTLGAALVAAALAAIAVRVPEILPLLPRAPMEFAVNALGATNQEQIADAEFLGTWLFAFALVVAAAYLTKALLRLRQRQ